MTLVSKTYDPFCFWSQTIWKHQSRNVFIYKYFITYSWWFLIFFRFGESILKLLNASLPVGSPKLWKLALTFDGSPYIDGLVYGDQEKDVRQLMMFMRDDQSIRDTHQSPNDMSLMQLGYKFIDDSILHKLNGGA